MGKFAFIETGIEGLYEIAPAVYRDGRGYFLETYNERDFKEVGITDAFVQDNQAQSVRGVLRGLHYQRKYPQGKLARVLSGEVFVVAVDMREGSGTYGKWHGVRLSEENKRQLYMPKGFAHGFLVLSEEAVFAYKCTEFYHPEDEAGILWSDERIGIVWPDIELERLLSEKDKKWPRLAETIVKLIEAVEGGKKAPLGVYHYTNEGEATWHEFAKAMYEERRGLGIITKDRAVIPCATEEYPTKAKRPVYSVLDKTKIKDALRIEAPEWKASLKKFLISDIAHFHLTGSCQESLDIISELKMLLKTQEVEHKATLDGERQKHFNELNDELCKLREKYEAKIVKITKEKESIQDTCNYYSTRHRLSLNERDALQSKLSSVEAAFNSIVNSEFWRITKPARVIMDITKPALKRLPLIKWLYKFIAHWKNSGLKNAIAKSKMFFSRKKRASHKKYQMLSIKEYKRQRNTRFERKVKFSVLTPLYNTPEKLLVETLESVRRQTYMDWELCLADGSDGRHGYVEKVCRRLSREDKRIRYKKLENNLGISGNTNVCVDMSTGDYIGLLDHDDLLHPSALFEAMKVVCEKNADVIYTDEDKTDAEGEKCFDPHFKPDFAIDNLRAYNYICHFLVFKKELLNEIGGFDSRYDGAQDYDLTLRLTERAKRVAHIPKVLYHWRVTTSSTAFDVNTKTYAIEANIKAVESHLKRCGLSADVASISPTYPTVHRVIYKLLGKPLVSIIIANKDHAADLEKCVSSIARLTSYSNYEMVIIENNSEMEETFLYYEEIKKNLNAKVVVYNGGFNYSKINNFGVRHTSGEYVILLNNDIEIISSGWIEEMLMLCQRDDVGAVGAKLYYFDNTIQHGGVILGIDGVTGHSHKCFPGSHPGYFLRLSIQQDLSAVTAACVMIKREVFDEIEGFNNDFAVAFNDIDLCMRIRKAGHLIVWTPFAEAYHYESKSRGLDDSPEKRDRFTKEAELFQRLWFKELSDGDPYYNVNLTLEREDFSLA